ncbi:DUF1129 domain-containing protein [Weissella paramesenteroides]|uniref:DUF1129 domain-containing protein n=1 Tax=Weissella paramesenteroides TaxID=1249 RepID=UPI00223C48A0|nr:DUF1129 domain-containing protein [Weissella paramesenteroides]
MTESKEQTQSQAPKPTLPTVQELATSGLTNRNQEFIRQMVILANGDESKAQLITEVGAKLLTAQKTGVTAKQLYNSPAEAMGLKTEAEKSDDNRGYASYGFWPLAIDNAIAFFMMFSFMFGLTLLFSGVKSSSAGSAGAAGITSLVLTSILGGIFFSAVTLTLAPRRDGKHVSFWKKTIVTVGAFAIWFLAYLGFAFLPAVINPLLPGWVYLVIAVIAFLGFRYWRAKTGIKGGFLGANAQPQSRKK